MKSSKALLGFSFFAVLATLLTYTIWSTLQRSVPGNTTSYSAVFTDVLGLRIGDDVRMAGVRVGRIDKIDFTDNYIAKVDFQIEARQHLTDTTKALVRYQNLIGQRYLALAPGTGEGTVVPAGSQIPLERTEPSFDVSALLSGFEPLFSVLQPDQINSLSETLIQALQGNEVSLAALITQAAQLASTFGERDQIIGDVLSNLSSVMAGLANRSDELETLITQTRSLMDGLYTEGESLKSSVERVAGATNGLVSLIEQVKPGLADAQRNATTGVMMLLYNGAALDRAAVEFPDFLNGVARFTQYGTYSNTYVCSLGRLAVGRVSCPRAVLPGRRHLTLGSVPMIKPPFPHLCGTTGTCASVSRLGVTGIARRFGSDQPGPTRRQDRSRRVRPGRGPSARATVDVAGIEVGEVQAVKLVNDRVEVALRIRKDIRLGANAHAAIKMSTILGRLHIVLRPGDGKELPDNRIRVDNTEVPYNLSKVIQDPQYASSFERIERSTRTNCAPRWMRSVPSWAIHRAMACRRSTASARSPR